MAEDVEQIEGKLCAYVDGDLDPAQRLDLETHLESNPSHRVLLSDLALQRQLIRQLPREKAPVDLNELLQSQLERDALLGSDSDNEEETRHILRINRWPQFLSAAAILALALGLGIVVYSVLPTQHPLVSIAPQTSPETKSPVTIESADDAPTPKEEAEAAPMIASGARSALRSALPSVLAGKPADLATPARFFEPAVGNDTLLIKVQPHDPNLANGNLVRFLSDNNIAWSNADQDTLGLPGLNDSSPQIPAESLTFAGISKDARQDTGFVGLNSDLAAASLEKTAPIASQPTQVFQEITTRHSEYYASSQQQFGLGGASIVQAEQQQSLDVTRKLKQVDSAGQIQTAVDRKNYTVNRNGRVILARNLNSDQLAQLTALLKQEPAQADQSKPILLRVMEIPLRERASAKSASAALSDAISLAGTSAGGGGGGELIAPATRPADGLFVGTSATLTTAPPTAPANARLDLSAPTTQPTQDQPTNLFSTDQDNQWLAARPPTTTPSAYNCVIVLEETPAPATQPAPTTQP